MPIISQLKMNIINIFDGFSFFKPHATSHTMQTTRQSVNDYVMYAAGNLSCA